MRWRVPGRSHLRGRHLLHRRRQVHRLRNLRKRLSYRRHRGSLNVSTMTGCPSGQLFLCPDAVLHTCMSAAAVPGLLLQDDGQGIASLVISLAVLLPAFSRGVRSRCRMLLVPLLVLLPALSAWRYGAFCLLLSAAVLPSFFIPAWRRVCLLAIPSLLLALLFKWRSSS